MPPTFSALLRSRSLWWSFIGIYFVISWYAILWLPGKKAPIAQVSVQQVRAENDAPILKTGLSDNFKKANSEHKHPRDWVDYATLLGLIVTGAVVAWQGFYMRQAVVDSRLSRMVMMVDSDKENWIREVVSSPGKKRLEITATIRNLTIHTCRVEWYSGNIQMNKMGGFKKSYMRNKGVYRSIVVEGGGRAIVSFASKQEFTDRQCLDMKTALGDTLETHFDGIERPYFWGTLSFKTMFNEKFWAHYLGHVEWDGNGIPSFHDDYDKHNHTEQVEPRFRSAVVLFFAGKLPWVYQGYVRTKGFFFPYKPPNWG